MIKKNLTIFFLLLLSFLWARHGVGPVYIVPDGIGYYSYLPSLFIDNDMDFENEFRCFKMTYPLAVTPTGYISNIWPIGTAFFLTPFFLFALMLWHLFSNWIVLNLNLWLILFTNLGSSLYGCAAGWVSYYGLRFIGLSAPLSWFAVLIVFFGTPLFCYTFSQPNSSHPISAFTVAIFLFYWMRSREQGRDDIMRWILLGILLGLGTMVRIEQCLYAVAPLAEICVTLAKEPKRRKSQIRNILLFFAGFILGLSPELIALKILYGSLTFPQGFNVSIRNFALFEVLFSPYNGVMFWMPLLLIAVAGFLIAKERPMIRRVLLFTVFLQILTASCAVAWWSGGTRLLLNCIFPVTMGIGFILQESRKFRGAIFAAIVCFLLITALWAFSLNIQVMLGWIDFGNIVFASSEIWNWQKRSLAMIPAAVSGFFGKKYTILPEHLLLFAAVCLFLWAANRVRIAFGSSVRLKSIMIVLVLILAFDFKLIYAHLKNSSIPAQNRKQDKFITQDKLQKIFLIQAIHVRWYYHLRRNELQAAKTDLKRQIQLEPDRRDLKELLRQINLRLHSEK